MAYTFLTPLLIPKLHTITPDQLGGKLILFTRDGAPLFQFAGAIRRRGTTSSKDDRTGRPGAEIAQSSS